MTMLTTPSAPSSSEQDLIERVQRNDPAACERFVRCYSGRMLAVAGRYFPCESDRDDAVQDAFLSAFRSIGAFRADSGVSTWLHRITINACLMKLRARKSRPESSIRELLPSFDHAGHHTHPVASWGGDAFDRVATEETRAHVRRCIEDLPNTYRSVLLLRDIEELDTHETARLLGISATAVKTRLHRARQALRTLLEPHFVGT